MNAVVPAETASRAFLQATLLRRIASDKPIVSTGELALELGRDKSNTRKSLQALERDGLITPTANSGPVLTSMGERALLALDVATGAAEVAGGILQLAHTKIRPNPLNPRTSIDSDALNELAASIDAVAQIIVPLIVFPPGPDGVHTLAAGERRWRAVGLLIDTGHWPADRPLPCMQREEDPAQTALIGLIENSQRQDLSLWDQAQAYVALMDATGWSAREAALKTGKSPRAVQEAVQVARNADEEQVEAFRRGAIRWEDLRNGVRKPADKTLADLVVSDHPDDKAELERRGQQSMHRTALEGAEMRVAKQAKAELTPAQALILHEVEAAIRARPELKAPLGPTVRLQSNIDFGAKVNADAAHLVSEGLISVSGSWPTTVALLRGGQAWLAAAPDATRDALARLRAARAAAGLDDAQRDALEIDEAFATPWLNVPKPPPPVQVSDAELLVLLELHDWTERQKKDARHSGAPVRHNFDRAELKSYADRQLIYGTHGYDYATGLWRLSVGYKGAEVLKAAYPKLDDASARSKARAQLHDKLGVSAPAGGNGYATVWLNPEITPDPAFAEKKRLRDEEAREAEESRRALEAARAKLAAGFAQLEAAVARLDLEGARRRIAEFLPAIGAMAPWSLDTSEFQARLRTANGAALELYDGSGRIGVRLALMALNLVAGVPPADWPTSGDMARPQFEGAIVDAVMKAIAEGQPDVALTRDRAAELARAQLDGMLREEGILYGDDEYDWTSSGSDALASAILTDLEQGTPPPGAPEVAA